MSTHRPARVTAWRRAGLSLAGALVVACAPVRPGEAPDDVASYRGEVRSAIRWDVRFEVAGRVRETTAVVGQRIEAGAVLAALDPAPYDRELEQAESDLDIAHSRLAALGNYMRPDDIRAFLPSVVAPRSMDGLRISVIEAEIGRAVASTRARFAQQARESTRLVAPARGRVVRQHVRAGDRAAAGMIAFEFEDPDTPEIAVRMPPAAATRLRPGRRALVRVDGVPGAELHAQLLRVGEGDASGGSREVLLRIVERAVLPIGAGVDVRFP